MPGDWYSDTDPRAMKLFIEAQRRLTPGEKIAAVFEMSEFIMRLAEDNVRKLHPEFTEREVFLSAASRWHDRDTMKRVYGWDPEATRK